MTVREDDAPAKAGGGELKPQNGQKGKPPPAVAEAVAAVVRGLRVIPIYEPMDGGGCSCRKGADCLDPGKHPRITGWQTAAATTAREVEAWTARWPWCGFGVLTGRPSGVVVLDVDPRNGGDAALAELVAEHGELPATVEATTGGGGRHLYFRHPGGTVDNGTVGPGLDVKADGGFVVLAGSPHASGARYRWRDGRGPDQVEVAKLPGWLLRRMSEKKQKCPEVLEGQPSPSSPTSDASAASPEADRLLAALPADVAEAVRDSVPKAPGTRNQRAVHRLARYMAGMFPGSDPADHEAVVRAWHALSLPTMTTGDFDVSYADFLYALPRVTHPLRPGGGGKLEAAADRAMGAADPPEAAAFDSPGCRFLVRLFRELTPLWPDGVVPMPQSVAGRLLRRAGFDCDDRTAGRWLGLLEVRKVIERVAEHTASTGRRFHYLLPGDDAEEGGAE